MKPTVTHDRLEETPKAKALWFRGLSLDDRMAALCAFTDLALQLNPRLVEMKDAQQTRQGVQVLSRT